jgi:hypothetical protein
MSGSFADNIFMKGIQTGGQRSPQTAAAGRRPRLNVFSSGQIPVLKHYNGRSYYHFPNPSEAGMRSDNMVQTEALSGGHEESHRASSLIKREQSATVIPKLTKSGSSASSLGIINGNQLSEIFNKVSEQEARNSNNMSPIKIKNYPFRGILSQAADMQQPLPNEDLALKQVQST